MSTIFVDVDGVVADLLPAWLDRYNKDSGDKLQNIDVTEWGLHKFVKPEWKDKIYDYLEDPTLYDDVHPVDNALENIEALRHQGYRIVFATATPVGSAGRKLKWLIDHNFIVQFSKDLSSNPDYIEIKDKSLLDGSSGNVLIDDGIHNVKAFKGLGILFRNCSNRTYEWPVDTFGWNHVTDMILHWELPIGTHPTELRRPKQCKAFRELLDKMYQVHLDKNFDYSPANILGTGEIGLMTRTWDKVSRLMNLMGFKVEINSFTYQKQESPKNESIEDTIQDLGVYSMIWQLYRKGVWGR